MIQTRENTCFYVRAVENRPLRVLFTYSMVEIAEVFTKWLNLLRPEGLPVSTVSCDTCLYLFAYVYVSNSSLYINRVPVRELYSSSGVNSP